ncbi:MAG: hypothetical protein ACOX2O_08850 [Bdellovibrionota bacterium]|jgi:hypothetical protein
MHYWILVSTQNKRALRMFLKLKGGKNIKRIVFGKRIVFWGELESDQGDRSIVT